MKRRVPWKSIGIQTNFDRYKYLDAVYAGGYSKTELDWKARHVAAYLAYRAKTGTSHDRPMTCWPSQSLIAEATGLSRSSVQRAIKELDDRGFLYIEKTFECGKAGQLREFNKYHLCLPERVTAVLKKKKANKTNGSKGSGVTVNHRGPVRRHTDQNGRHSGQMVRLGDAVTKNITMNEPREEFSSGQAEKSEPVPQYVPLSDEELSQEKDRQLRDLELKKNSSADS